MFNSFTAVSTKTLLNVLHVGLKEGQILIKHVSHLGRRGQGEEDLSKFQVVQTVKIEVKLSGQILNILVQFS